MIAFAKERLANFKVPRQVDLRRRPPPQPVGQGARPLRAAGRLSPPRGPGTSIPTPSSWPSRPRRGSGWRPTCRPSRCRRWTRPRAGRATRSGRRARRGPVVGGLVAAGVPRSRGVAGRVGDLRGGVLPSRRARPGLPERHLPAGPDHLRPRHPEQQDRFLPTMATGEQIWAQCWSEPEAGSDLASLPSTARRDDERGGWRAQRPEDLVVAGDVRALGLRSVPLRPGGRRHRGLTYFLFPLDADGITVRRSPSSTARPGFAEVVLRGRLRPRLRRARRRRRRLVRSR